MKKEQFPSWTLYLSLCLQLQGTCRPCSVWEQQRQLFEVTVQQSHSLLEKVVLFQFQLKICILLRSDWKHLKGFGNCFNLQRTLVCTFVFLSVPSPLASRFRAGVDGGFRGWPVLLTTLSCEQGTRFLTVGGQVHVDLHVDGLMLPLLAWFSVCWGLQLLLISGI